MATKDDAALIVQIMQWAGQTGIDDAFAQLHAEGFDPEVVDIRDRAVHKVLTYGETIGTFVKQGLLDRDLVYDLWAVPHTWRLVGPTARKVREHSGEPRMYENFEALARGVPAAVG